MSHRNEYGIRRAAALLEAYMARYGYEIRETPLIEPADLFLTKAGDQIITKLLTFERSGKQLALRPEFTASAAQAYIEEVDENDAPVRWQFNGYIFEDDADAADNDSLLYQWHTVGAECIGMAGVEADAEIIAMSVGALASLNIPDVQLDIGHVGLLRSALGRFHLDSRTTRLLLTNLHALLDRVSGKSVLMERIEHLLHIRVDAIENSIDENTSLNTEQMLDVLLDATQRGETMGGRTRQDIVRRLLKKRERAAERSQIAEAVDFLNEYIVIQGDPHSVFTELHTLVGDADKASAALLTQWEHLIDLLHLYGIQTGQMHLNPIHSRWWDYYTGVVFELVADRTHIGGGGRYDELIQLMGGRSVPAVGMVIDTDAAEGLMPRRDEEVAHPPTHITYTAHTLSDAIQWAARLRKQGVAVALVDQPQRSHALSISSDHELIVGDHAFTALQLDAALAAIANLPQESPLHDAE